jgi:hypothetical protein
MGDASTHLDNTTQTHAAVKAAVPSEDADFLHQLWQELEKLIKDLEGHANNLHASVHDAADKHAVRLDKAASNVSAKADAANNASGDLQAKGDAAQSAQDNVSAQTQGTQEHADASQAHVDATNAHNDAKDAHQGAQDAHQSAQDKHATATQKADAASKNRDHANNMKASVEELVKAIEEILGISGQLPEDAGPGTKSDAKVKAQPHIDKIKEHAAKLDEPIQNLNNEDNKAAVEPPEQDEELDA